MTHHAAQNPKRIPPPIRDPGSAHKHAQSHRRHSTVEGTNTYVGDPTDIGVDPGGTGTGGPPYVGSASGTVPPGVEIDTPGFMAYDVGGNLTMLVDGTNGSVTINPNANAQIYGALIDGSTVRTGGTFPSVVMNPSGIYGYNAGGVQEVFISATDGSFWAGGQSTITGGTFETAVVGQNPRLAFTGAGIVGYNASGTQTISIGVDGAVTFSGSSTITGGTFQSSLTYPRLIMDSSGLRAYNNLNQLKFQVTSDGILTNSGGTITGGIVQTSATNPRVVMDTTGLHSYDSTGLETFGLDASDGSLTLGAIEGSIVASTSGVSVSSKPDTSTSARIVINAQGITGYDASNTAQFLLDDTTGLIEATGILTSQPGSTVPWQTTGFYIGGGNLLFNASAEDPTTQQQLLYMNAGASITAGTLQLQYGTNTPSAAINWNATAAQVQSALQAAGVLPTGATVACTGGPLPATPITISLGNLGLSPTLLSPVSQTLTGGSAVVGPMAVLQYANNLPSRWWSYANGVFDHIPLAQSYHGSSVFRLTATSAGSPSASQTVGPWGLKIGTQYTLSAYFKAPTAVRNAQITLSFQDITGNTISTTTATSDWTTSGDWQRVLVTDAVPLTGARQQIAILGSPQEGFLQLQYGSDVTAPLQYNSTAAQVLAALQALPSVGVNGVTNATGGPWPANPIQVTFLVPNPQTLTAINSLGTPFTGALGTKDSRLGKFSFGVVKGTGGTARTGVTISNVPATQIGVQFSVLNAAAGEVFYIDACQLEVGDAPTGFAPQPDEIVANTIQANMINVSQLSAITANLGQITAGTVTGATFQSATSGARIVMDSAGLRAFDSSGITQTFTLSAANGSFTAVGGIITGATIRTSSTPATTGGTQMDASGYKSYDPTGRVVSMIPVNGGINLIADSTVNTISWRNDPTAPQFQNEIGSITSGGYTNPAQNYAMYLIVRNPFTTYTNPCEIALNLSPTYDIDNSISASVTNAAQTATHMVTIIDGTGQSTFPGNVVAASMVSNGTIAANGRYFGNVNAWPFGGCTFADFNLHVIEMGWSGSLLQWYVDGTAVNCASSVTLKKNINTIEKGEAISIVKNLRGVTFNWKEAPFDQNKFNYGLLAEEVATAFPSAVHNQPHPNEPDRSQIFLDELPLIAVLVESVKELNSRLERLEQIDTVGVLTKLLTDGQRPALDALVRTLELRHFELDIDHAIGGDTTEELATLEGALQQLGGPTK